MRAPRGFHAVSLALALGTLCAGCGDDQPLHEGAGGNGATTGAGGGTGGSGAGAAAGGASVGWMVEFGDVDDDEGASVVVDMAGNSYIVGSFRGEVDMGAGALTSAGSADVVVASYDPSGACRWSTRFGGVGQDLGASIALGPGGDLWIAGQFQDIVAFGATELTYVGATDAFVARLHPDGTPVWARGFGGDIVDLGVAVDVDATGNAYFTGTFMDAVDFGGTAISSAGGTDVFVVSLDPDGATRWAKGYGAAANENVTGIAVEPGGSWYLTGWFGDPFDLGGGPLPVAGESDLYLGAFTTGGQHRWSKSFGGPGADYGIDVDVDDANHAVAITGAFHDSIDFGTGALDASLAIFVAAFDGDGKPSWSAKLGGQGTSRGDGVSIAADGRTYVTGTGFGSLIMAGFDASGAELWSRTMLESGPDQRSAIAAAPGDAVIVTGSFHGSRSAGGSDGFVLELAPGAP